MQGVLRPTIAPCPCPDKTALPIFETLGTSRLRRPDAPLSRSEKNP